MSGTLGGKLVGTWKRGKETGDVELVLNGRLNEETPQLPEEMRDGRLVLCGQFDRLARAVVKSYGGFEIALSTPSSPTWVKTSIVTEAGGTFTTYTHAVTGTTWLYPVDDDRHTARAKIIAITGNL
jgi:hypothetical protein